MYVTFLVDTYQLVIAPCAVLLSILCVKQIPNKWRYIRNLWKELTVHAQQRNVLQVWNYSKRSLQILTSRTTVLEKFEIYDFTFAFALPLWLEMYPLISDTSINYILLRTKMFFVWNFFLRFYPWRWDWLKHSTRLCSSF